MNGEGSDKELDWTVSEFVKHWSRDEVSVEENRLVCRIREEAMMALPKTATKLWTVPSVRKAFMSVDAKWVWK